MRVLIDTNVFLDTILQREPFFRYSATVIAACRELIIQGSVAAQSVADMFYILRKDRTLAERRIILLDVCQIMDVQSIDKDKLVGALFNEDFSDFEDCLQAECASTFKADYIVTQNTKHFVHSPIPAITPEDFCRQFLSVSE